MLFKSLDLQHGVRPAAHYDFRKISGSLTVVSRREPEQVTKLEFFSTSMTTWMSEAQIFRSPRTLGLVPLSLLYSDCAWRCHTRSCIVRRVQHGVKQGNEKLCWLR